MFFDVAQLLAIAGFTYAVVGTVYLWYGLACVPRLGDVLFADGNGTAPYLFDLREPYAPEEEDEQSEGKQDAN